MKFNRYFLSFVFVFFFFQLDVFASTKTYTRTVEELLVPKDVTVNESNINIILNTPAVDASEKVYDYANFYTEGEEKKLYKRINQFVSSSNIDVAIVTTNNLNGYLIKDYAYQFYDYNDFKSDGVVFVIYVNDGPPEIFMGNSGEEDGKVFSIYTDNRINDILKYIYPDIKSANYYSATSTYVKILQGFFDIDRGGDYRVGEQGKIIKIIPWVEIIILAMALSFISVMFFVYRLKKYNQYSCQGFFSKRIDNSTLNVKVERDEFLDSVILDKK